MIKIDFSANSVFNAVLTQKILGIGSSKFNTLINTYGHYGKILRALTDDSKRILSPKETECMNKISSAQIDNIIDRCRKSNIRIIKYTDDEYPEGFRCIEEPPVVIYARGRKIDKESPAIAVVGARKATEFGKKAAYSLSARLALSGFSVISGGAAGIDIMSHMGALAAGGNTIMILGCGIDSNYLSKYKNIRDSVEKFGTLISEMEPGTHASKYTFPIRNRLISAMADGVAVVEAGKTSGSLITATYAMEQGKEIFAIPGSINMPEYEGGNSLLRDGAIPLISVDDIIFTFSGRFSQKIKTDNELTKGIINGCNRALEVESSPVIRAKAAKENQTKKISGSNKSAKSGKKEKAPYGENESENESENVKDKVLPEGYKCSKEAKSIYEAFTKEIQTADELSAKSGVCGGNFIAAITELEIWGLIKAVPVGRYKKL